MHWHTHMQVTLGVKVQSNCFQFFFCLFSPLEVGDASWYQPVLPHKQRTPAGIKPRSSALCCPAAGLIRSDAAFNSSQGSLTNNPFFFNDGGRLIRRYGWRGPADRTAGAAVMFTRSVGSVCSIYSVHLNVDCVCALGASCSRTNLLFLHNHISAWKGNFISGFCARVRDGFDVQKHVAAFLFFFPFMKPFLEINGKIFCRTSVELESVLSVYVGLQLSDQVIRWLGAFLIFNEGVLIKR